MNQSMELAVVREALQSRLLVELMGNAMHKELVLKGGMAMRAVHGIDEDAFEDMRLQVGTSVEKWLKAATEASGAALLPGAEP